MIKTEGYRKEWKAMKGNLILIHGGGPTAVINASLAGAIRQAKKEPNVDRILAAIGGTGGLMRGQVRDLTDITEEELALLERTPGSAIGTSRDALEEPEYRLLAEKCVELGAKYVLMNGGNGTMDACGKLCRMLAGTDIRVMGIPKTMDNDIAVTDHAPGFGSAARYIAQSVAEVTADVRGLPIHVVVIEASGRNAGWITAASALARQAGVDGPDLIYLPETDFSMPKFIEDVKKVYNATGNCIVAVSEGIHYEDGGFVSEAKVAANDGFGHAQLGGLATILAEVLKEETGAKVRGIELNLLQRCAAHLASETDIEESYMAGKVAVENAVNGINGRMIGFERGIQNGKYACRTKLVPLVEVANVEKKIPREWINEEGNGVNHQFIEYALPLIQGEPELPKQDSLPRFVKLKKVLAK